MPFDYRIDVARRLVISRAWGVLTTPDLLGHAATLGKDPRFRPDMRQLVDFCDVTKLEITTDTVRQMVALNPFLAGSRRALVFGSAGAYGMGRMYQLLSDATPDVVELFRALEPALEWLGLAKDDAEVLAALETIRASARELDG